MSNYRTLPAGFWHNMYTKGMSFGAKALWAYLYTCDQYKACGILSISRGAISAELSDIDPEPYLDELQTRGVILQDTEMHLVFLIGAIQKELDTNTSPAAKARVTRLIKISMTPYTGHPFVDYILKKHPWLGMPDANTITTTNTITNTTTEQGTSDEVRCVLTHYVKQSDNPVTDKHQEKLVAQRIAEGHSVDTLCDAIDGMYAAEWCISKSLRTALKDADTIHQFSQAAKNSKQGPPKVQHNYMIFPTRGGDND